MRTSIGISKFLITWIFKELYSNGNIVKVRLAMPKDARSPFVLQSASPAWLGDYGAATGHLLSREVIMVITRSPLISHCDATMTGLLPVHISQAPETRDTHLVTGPQCVHLLGFYPILGSFMVRGKYPVLWLVHNNGRPKFMYSLPCVIVLKDSFYKYT